LEFLAGIGKDKIEKHNKLLAAKAKKEFVALGILPDASLNRKETSTIFNISANETMFQHLTTNGVVCAQRGNGVRMGFHFYNTEDEIEAIVEILKKAL